LADGRARRGLELPSRDDVRRTVVRRGCGQRPGDGPRLASCERALALDHRRWRCVWIAPTIADAYRTRPVRREGLSPPGSDVDQDSRSSFSPSSGRGRYPKGDRRVAHPLPSSAGTPVARTAAQAGRENISTPCAPPIRP
jgi:hypothetical protein